MRSSYRTIRTVKVTPGVEVHSKRMKQVYFRKGTIMYGKFASDRGRNSVNREKRQGGLDGRRSTRLTIERKDKGVGERACRE